MAKPTKRKIEGGRVKPEGSGGRVTAKGTVPHGDAPKTATYTNEKLGPSPTWVPVLMFGLLGVGALVIILNYLELLPTGHEGASNWYLLLGLGLILGGIITATQFR